MWAVGAVVAVGTMAYLWWPKDWSGVPVLDQHTTVNFPQPVWNGYHREPAPPVQRTALEPDPRIDELQRQLEAMRRAEAEQNKLLQELRNRKEPAPKQEEPKKAPPHRPMGYMAFALPEEPAEKDPLYTLAPGDTKMPCIVETKMHSDVESQATVKLTTNIYDTKTRKRLLVPQGSTLLLRYHSKYLMYGNQRLPITSTLLTLPNGTVIELDGEPIMDVMGQAGLVSRVDNHFWRAVPAVLIQGVLRGSQQTISTTNPFAADIAGSAAQYGQKVTQPYIDMRPTIAVDAGEACTAILTRTVALPEYREGK
jgi:type IV secretory pathway VirB10-like protein